MVRNKHESTIGVRFSLKNQCFILLLSLSSIPSSPTSINADRYLLKVLRRARNRFIQSRHSSTIDNQSDSGVFTSSSITNFTDDYESDSLRDTDEDYLQSTDANDPNNELLCQSLEVVLMETLMELRQHRQQRSMKSEQVLITRL